MKKVRIGAMLLLLCLLTACSSSSRKAQEQFSSGDFLYTGGTDVYDASGTKVQLCSKTFSVSAAKAFDQKALSKALSDDQYNSIKLELCGDLMDDGSTPWSIKGETFAIIDTVLEQCTQAKKYLLIGIYEYPREYNAWLEETDFDENICALWQQLAEKYAVAPYLGAYVISDIPRPGASEDATALSYYEEVIQRVCDAIRTKDAKHMICVSPMLPYSANEDQYHGFPYVKDANFAYIAPIEDLSFYADQTKTDGEGCTNLFYPNQLWHNIVSPSYKSEIVGSDIDFSSQDYQTRATHVFKVEEENCFAQIGVHVTPEDDTGGGELRVWTVRFAECDKDGKELRVLYDIKTSVDVPFISRTSSGAIVEGSVYETDSSAYLESINEPVFFCIKNLNIPVEKDKYYQLTVTMKQRGMNKYYKCAPHVELYDCASYDLLDAAYLQKCTARLFDEAKAVGVPLLFDEIGVGQLTLMKDRGGKTYLSDLKSAITALEQGYINR